MPELPEVETIRRQLEGALRGATIKNIVVRSSKPLNVSAKKFIAAVRGAKIKEVGRRAKLLFLYLTPSAASSRTERSGDAGSYVLLFHLKMTGRLLLAQKNAEPTKHTHLVFELTPSSTSPSPLCNQGGVPEGRRGLRGRKGEGGYNLFFEDYRKFGFVKLLEEKDLEKYLEGQGYGPEPLSSNFNYKIFKECLLAHKNKKIKQILMEQSCVAGIGNIYAAEICFFSGVRPDRKIGNIKESEFKKIYEGIKKILTSAIKSRGTSADSYVDAYGKQGTFVPKLKVYDREGEKCFRCGGIIKKEKLASRGTYWCPGCQK